MRVKDIYINFVSGKIVVQNIFCDEICRINTVESAVKCYKVLEKNKVLNSVILFLEVVNNILYITI